MSVCDPLAIHLASSGSRGDKLLFRYPYETEDSKQTIKRAQSRNPYAIRIEEDYSAHSYEGDGTISSYSDRDLCHLLAVKSALSEKPFEVKVEGVLFAGYPVLLPNVSQVAGQPSPGPTSTKRQTPTIISFNVVFALQGDADCYAVWCYQDLARQIAAALRHEERRCSYLTTQKCIFSAIQDEVSAMPEDSMESPYHLMLQRSPLAKQLKTIYNDVCNTGVVQTYINKWVRIEFCLPQKVHNMSCGDIQVKAEDIHRCLAALRPYHTMLLVVDDTRLQEELSQDCSPALLRLIQVNNPLKGLQQLAMDADISLGQVRQLVSHLVYWGKAIIIYPLCESNVYVLSPDANTSVTSSLVEKFAHQFSGFSLPAVMSEYSLPTPLGGHRDVLGLPQIQMQQVRIVVWMLQHRLLVQLHTYIYFLPQASTCATTRTREHILSSTWDDSLSCRQENNTTETSQDSNEEGLCNGAMSLSIKMEPPVSDKQDISIPEPLPATYSASQKEAIMEVPASSNEEDLQLFSRLCKYFDGQHHLEEIMYYENIPRSQLLILLDKFRSVLVTCQHQDSGIASTMET